MEESHDMHSKGAIIPPGKAKRKLKTPFQIKALEKFYNDNKYPSESTKLQFAKQIGLSEKQVSGWLCHRRLKDKKLLQGEGSVNGKHSLSNGAIHDHISGIWQESCSSTKQGDKHFDSKEVESKRFYSRNYSAVLASEHNQRIHVGHYTVAEDRSSGSSSASQERMLQRDQDPYALKPSMSFRDDNYMLMNTKGVKSRAHMMDSRYSYLPAEIENPAVSSVKRKLGKHYREDGPTLGVVFDSLPPGAFDSPIRDSNIDPYYVGDSIQQTSYSIPRIFKEPKLYDKYRCEMLSSGSYPEGIVPERTIQGYHHPNEFNSCQLTPKALFIKNNENAPNRTFVMENSEDSAGKVFEYKSRKNGKCFKYRVEGGADNSGGRPFHLNGLKKTHTNKSSSYPCVQYNCSEPVFPREDLGAKFAKSALQRGRFLDTEDATEPRRPIKKGKIFKDPRTLENQSFVRQEMLITSETKMGRKSNGVRFQPPQVSVMKSSEKFQTRTSFMRYSGNVATSFSEDETGDDTNSSVD